MTTLTRSRRFHALTAVVLLMFATAHAAVAREIKYPTDTPAFTFQLPEGWNVEHKGGSSDALYFTAKDDSGLNLQFFSIANEEIGTDNQKFTEAALRAGKVRDIQVVKSDKKALKGGPEVKYVRSTFKDPSGAAYISLMIFLPIGSERTCAIHCFMPEKQLESHQAQVEKLLDSIVMLE